MYSLFKSNQVKMKTTIQNLAKVTAILICALMVMTAIGQDEIKITTTIIPPYPTKLYQITDQPNKVIVMVTNNTGSTKYIYLLGSLNMESGGKVYTDPGKKGPKITLAANQTLKLTQDNVQAAFDGNKLIWEGLNKEKVIKDGLPEDDYLLCFRAYDYSTNQALSPEELGCGNWPIKYVDPPILWYPKWDTVIPDVHFAYSWARPANAPPSSEYVIEIVDIMPAGRDPNEAFRTASNPRFFTKTLMTTSYAYSAADPKFIPGHSYAWRVIIKDKKNETTFKNGGVSETGTFYVMDGPVPNACKKTFKVYLKKHDRADSCCYDLAISNNYEGPKKGAPAFFTIAIDDASIIGINDSTPPKWGRSPKLPVHSISWSTKSGFLDKGKTKLGNICFGNYTADPVYLYYTWLDKNKNILCKDSVRLDCPQEPLCCLYYLVFSNKASSNLFQTIKIKPSGANITGIFTQIDNEYLFPNEIEWTESHDQGYQEITFNHNGPIPMDANSECLEFNPGLQIDNVTANSKIEVSWYGFSNNLIAQHIISLRPCNINEDAIETIDWQSFTQKIIGANLAVTSVAIPLPDECEVNYQLINMRECTNSIVDSIDCNSDSEHLIKLKPSSENSSSTYSWDVTNNGQTVTNQGSLNTFEFQIANSNPGAYRINATMNETESGSAEPCPYSWSDTIYVPILTIEYEWEAVTSASGDCNFEIKVTIHNNETLKDIVTYEYWRGSDDYWSSGTDKEYTFKDVPEGSHKITVKLTDKYGCQFSKDSTLELTYKCKPKFDWKAGWCPWESCETDILVTFINESAGGRCPKYEWDFGDGNTSDQKNPSHTYHVDNCNSNEFEVKLHMFDSETSQGEHACDTTITETINIKRCDFADILSIKKCGDGTVNFTCNLLVESWNFYGVSDDNIISKDDYNACVRYYPDLCVPKNYSFSYTVKCSDHMTCTIDTSILVTRTCFASLHTYHDRFGPEIFNGKKFRMNWRFKGDFVSEDANHKVKIKAITALQRRFDAGIFIFYLPAATKHFSSIYAGIEGSLLGWNGNPNSCYCDPDFTTTISESEDNTGYFRAKAKVKKPEPLHVNHDCNANTYSIKSIHDVTFKDGTKFPKNGLTGPFIQQFDWAPHD
jgi:TANFOR domain-containing protein